MLELSLSTATNDAGYRMRFPSLTRIFLYNVCAYLKRYKHQRLRLWYIGFGQDYIELIAISFSDGLKNDLGACFRKRYVREGP
jgi:hypothetical protein